MSLRIICMDHEFGAAANIGGPTHTAYKTFDVEAPAIEEWLREQAAYCQRSIVGVELVEKEKANG